MWIHIEIDQTRILLDNASIHLSGFTKRITKKLVARMMFLPQYSPQLAPVELVFGILKRKISTQRKQKSISFGSVDGRKEISFALNDFWQTKAKRLWLLFVNETKKWILLWQRERIFNTKVLIDELADPRSDEVQDN